jgi:hypothetical protein
MDEKRVIIAVSCLYKPFLDKKHTYGLNMKVDIETKRLIEESMKEKGVSVKGFSRREFAIMLYICQAVFNDDDILDEVNPFHRFKGLDLELPALAEKIDKFLQPRN